MWGLADRLRAVKWNAAVVLVVMMLLSVGSLMHTRGEAGWSTLRVVAFDVPLGVAAFALVRLRASRPLGVSVATSALAACSAFATGPAAFALASLAARRDRAQIVAATAASVASAAVLAVTAPSPNDSWWNQTAGAVVLSSAMIGWGLYVGSRRELVATLRRRAERSEADQEHRAQQARAAERTRIAREMHDVVAHHISQISMRAGALAFRQDLSATQLRSEAELIRDTANRSLRELRSVLHVLRSPRTDDLIEAPQPMLLDVPALVAQAEASGQRVDFTNAIDTGVPPEIGRTVYRIVQEGLMNAARHAPRAVVHVQLSDAGQGVGVIVSNRHGPGVGEVTEPGLGLIGVAERVELVGGHFERVISPDTFTIHAWLPCPR